MLIWIALSYSILSKLVNKLNFNRGRGRVRIQYWSRKVLETCFLNLFTNYGARSFFRTKQIVFSWMFVRHLVCDGRSQVDFSSLKNIFHKGFLQLAIFVNPTILLLVHPSYSLYTNKAIKCTRSITTPSPWSSVIIYVSIVLR